MSDDPAPLVGFTCAYTPLPLLAAAGFTPYRILPVGDAPDRAGGLLHDNLCPHVKRLLDRAVADDLPPLVGLVVMNSCDTMRRLADGWRVARPDLPVALVDLPVAGSARATAHFAAELERLADILVDWGGVRASGAALAASAAGYGELADRLRGLYRRVAAGELSRARLQELVIASVTRPPRAALAAIGAAEAEPALASPAFAVPLYLFGNVLVDPDGYALFERAGARLVGDELCTGGRQLSRMELDPDDGGFGALAAAVLARPVCARTLVDGDPDRLGDQLVESARAAGAAGVVAHVMKFCDPYLARLPAVAARLEQAGLPLLVLEGDCTSRSLGQQTTRIEAFVEMLGGY